MQGFAGVRRAALAVGVGLVAVIVLVVSVGGRLRRVVAVRVPRRGDRTRLLLAHPRMDGIRALPRDLQALGGNLSLIVGPPSGR